MPLYEYICEPNGHRFEVRHGMNEASPPGCPECNGPIRRVIQPVGIMFKGSGFYATDSRQSASKTGSEAKKETTSDKAPEAKPAADSSLPAASSGDTAGSD